jgi:hypothetical protein
MPSKVIVKNSVVAGARPATAATNKPGELFVNVADKVIGTFDAAGAPVELGPARYTLHAATAAALGGVKATPAVAGQFVTGIAADCSLTHGAPAAGGASYTLPAATAAALGGVKATAAVARQFITGFAADGSPTRSEISAATASALGGVISTARPANQFVTGVDAAGNLSFGHVQAQQVDAGPSFAAFGSSSTITAKNVYVKIILTTVEENKGNCFVQGTGKFTPNVPGWYLISAGAQQIGPTDYFFVDVHKNGTQEVTGACALINGTGVWLDRICSSTAALIKMNGTTDFLEMYMCAGGPVTLNTLRAGVYFVGCFVRPL